jgi:catechol 2,3-dioxygenase-like lactoylglutathione lyase family enzyme
MILNVHVEDAPAVARRLDDLGIERLTRLEQRPEGWFGTVTDPDGNLVHIIEASSADRSARRGRAALAASRVATRLPAQDLQRARRFYSDQLGLEPVEERDGGLRYECSGVSFALFESAGRPSGEHTQMGWEVHDLDAVVGELRQRGVTFEEYDLPGLQTVGGVADIDGNYPSRGAGERGAWFYHNEGNLLGLGQPVLHASGGDR